MNKPLVSVVIPVYRALDYIEQTIQSVMSQEVDSEIIIVEDKSDQLSTSIIMRYKEKANITYVENPKRLGVAANRNIGIDLARGKYIAFLDADDWWSDDKLKKQLKLIESKDTVLVYSGRELMSHCGEPTGKKVSVPLVVDYNKLLRGNVIPASSVLLKSQVAKEFPQHHDEFHEDYIMWLEILKKYGYGYGINEPMLKSRLSEGGKSRDKRKSALMTWEVYKLMNIGFLERCYLFVCYSLKGVLKYI